jgi:hypothetical protein
VLLETFKDIVNVLRILFFISRVDKDIIKIYNTDVVDKVFKDFVNK